LADHVLEPDDLADAASTLLRTGFHAGAGDDEAGTIVLKLQGELDMASAPALSRALGTALDAQPAVLTLDFSQLTFLDSTGLRVLITACRRATAEGRSFVIRSPSRSVLKTLQLTGVDQLMVIELPPPAT
jgi:anti-sigma B factor antagonist